MKAYCPKPFVAIRMDTDRTGGVRFRPCCHYDHSEPSLDQYLSSSHLADLQHHMLTQDQLPPECNHCAQQESWGMRSLRQIALTEVTEPPTQTQIQTIETFPSNICNLACVMCDSQHSSRIAQEQHAITGAPYLLIQNEDATLAALDRLPDLHTVSFIGGEFFMAKRNLEILDRVIQRGLQARIITNATVITDQLMQRLQQIPDLDLMISVDGTHSTYELIRWPAQWHETQHNIDQLRRLLPQARVHVYCVVQPLNWLNLGSLLNWANQNLLPVTMTNLQEPLWLSWAILQDHERQKFVTLPVPQGLTVKQVSEIQKFRGLIQRTQFRSNLRDQFETEMQARFRQRGLAWPASFFVDIDHRTGHGAGAVAT